jgi:hypothetical protein
VTGGSSCGFHASADDPADKWPDAWCDLCDDAFQAAGGEWNDVSEKVADIQLMCTHGYEAARSRNMLVPPLARGAGARLTEAETSALIYHAIHELQAVKERSEKRWGWGGLARWHFDDEASTLAFSEPGRSAIVADVRLVGSYSTKSGTFQWAWETFEAGAREAKEMARLRVFGEVRGIADLTTRNWKCDEAVAWDMASIAGYVLGDEGLYRAPFDHQRWFMLLTNWRHVN